MDFQERIIRIRPDPAFFDELHGLDEIEEENGLVFFKNLFDRKSSLIFFDDIRKLMCETKSGKCLVQRAKKFLEQFLKNINLEWMLDWMMDGRRSMIWIR